MKYIQPDWPAHPRVKAFVTSRKGWGGRQAHHDANKGNYTSNHPKYVEESHELKKLLDLPNEPIWITQTHSADVIEAKPENKEKQADASFTTLPNRVCVVLTADCLPILISNKQGTHVAAIHAGWRGLANGIVEATVKRLNLEHNDLLIWLGPAISAQKFEVGKDVYDAFVNQDPKLELAFKAHTENKWFADLYSLAKMKLNALGVQQIYGGDFCTYTQSDLFFSYRRDKGKTGRIASLIWLQQS